MCEGEISVGGVLHTHPGVHSISPSKQPSSPFIFVCCVVYLTIITYLIQSKRVHCCTLPT